MREKKRSAFHEFAAWVDGEDLGRPAPSQQVYHKSAKGRRLPINQLDSYQTFRRFTQLVGALFCITVFVVLLLTVLNLPRFGSPANPANNEVPQRYIEHGLEETGAANIVAGMILSYRVFDTFGESSVLFLAATCVTILLRRDEKNTTTHDLQVMSSENLVTRKDRDTVLRTAVLLLLPIFRALLPSNPCPLEMEG
jgi:multicomponent Na+:H+ antiporter subunit B